MCNFLVLHGGSNAFNVSSKCTNAYLGHTHLISCEILIQRPEIYTYLRIYGFLHCGHGGGTESQHEEDREKAQPEADGVQEGEGEARTAAFGSRYCVTVAMLPWAGAS
jgi:hypothetical protein